MAADAIPRQRIGKYELGDVLGRGTCGVVYRARDPFIGRDVAIKVAHPGKGVSPAATQRDRQQFFAEARAAGRLAHPHIVSVHDAAAEGDCNYIVMQYVAGRTLEAWGHAGRERLPVERTVDIVFRCCHALDYAHRQGVIHRDIKPSNILLSADGTPRITDFSIALMNAPGAAAAGRPGVAEGTPNYMAPEQVRGRDIGPRSDLYALGAVMFELLAGSRLFAERDVQKLFGHILHTPSPRLAERVPELPTAVTQIVDRALAKDPADRFATGAEFAAALAKAHDRLRRSERQLARAANRDLLRGVDFFDAFSDAEIDAVLESSTLVQYRRGEVLIREGDLDTSFYILVVGSAAVDKGGVRIESLRKGDCFGEMGFLGETRRTATLTAETDVAVLKVNKSMIDLAPMETRLLYYRTFAETLIYRLTVTSARLSSALQRLGGQAS